ncbi:MAG: hypothetical protein DRQ97_13295, partial [Gammaproteobacteria bacterium]
MNDKIITLLITIVVFVMSIFNPNQVISPDQDEAFSGNTNHKVEAAIPGAFDSVAYHLLQSKCMICHSTAGKTHEELVAPPIFAVKRRYSMAHESQETFVNSIVAWAKGPKEENAIMRGAVDNFKVMPYMNFEEADLEKIAVFIYENEMEKPMWFEQECKDKHADGQMGNGQGKGKGQGKGQGKGKCCK